MAYEGFAGFATFISRLDVLPFTEAAIKRYDDLRALRLNIGKPDLRIAVIALDGGLTLVTRNLRDFQRVPNLKLADWSI